MICSCFLLCVLNTYGSFILKTGMLFRKGSVFCSVSAGICLLKGILFKWGGGGGGGGGREDNRQLWSDGRSQRSLLYVILKGKDCK